MSPEELGRNVLPWHKHLHGFDQGSSPLQTWTHHLHCHCHHPHSLPLASCHHHHWWHQWVGFANVGVVIHGLCSSGEVVQAVGTDKARVVMHSSQTVNHCSLILTLFAAPAAEGQATSSSESLDRMDDLQQLCGQDDSEEMDVFWRGLAVQLVALRSFWPP